MAAPAPLKILILGGTGFIGPHFVRAAVARGHTVSIFNRGKSKADIPEQVERLLGDRDSDLNAIQNRDWDAVIDLNTYMPRWVRELGKAIKHRVGHYTFISTVLVYKDPSITRMTREDSPLLEYRGHVDPYSPALTGFWGEQYGPLKVVGEREAVQQFTGKALILRPGYIVGPGDDQDWFTYWPARMEHAGEVMVAGHQSIPVQFVDVRDLAQWSILAVERRLTGVYNAVGPTSPITLGQLVQAARMGAPHALKVTWVPSEWLAARDDREVWRKLLFWSYESEGFARIMRTDFNRAVTEGLTTRPVNITIADTFRWYKSLSKERQEQVLSPATKIDNRDRSILLPSSSSAYLQQEKIALAAYRKEL